MANKTPLASWLYSKRQELNPRFKEFNWPARVFPGLYDFSTTVSWNGVEAGGRGVDSQREIALEKSVAEAIERLICKSLGFDSVGFALAGTHDPSDHARFEAMERFFLKWHLENRIPFSQVSVENEDAQKFRSQNPDAELSFFRMQTPSQLFGIVCSLKMKKTQSTALGFGLSNSLAKSIQHSFREALPNFAWLMDEDRNIEFEMPWHIDTKFLLQIEPLLARESRDEETLLLDMPSLTRLEVEKSKISVLSNAPIQTARFLVAEGER
ncbi:MAG: hypothetical protein JNM39_07445 [Bdellovibrionaceae bacterium]|nr:hypothetical protein [Pseudobdellovibrionaceae bacterium]